jgi:hypothetical protein
MGRRLNDDDEGIHLPGDAENWNESRYLDVWDAATGVGGWFRIGARPNARYAEMSACIYLPDGSVACSFARPVIETNGLAAGDLSWEIVTPWDENRVRFEGEMMLLRSGWELTDPKTAFSSAPRLPVSVDLTCRTAGLDAALGQDTDQTHLVFLPGQADVHYQHMAHTTGTLRVGDTSYTVDGRGGKDHSWGPRNWHAKIYFRWLTAAIDDRNGFMLSRAVGPTAERRSGFVLDDGVFHIVDDFSLENVYNEAPTYALRRVTTTVRYAGKELTAVGTTRNWLPARHRQHDERGEMALLRIVKSPTDWEFSDGRAAQGHCEYHDRMIDGIPAGLHE